MADTKITGLQTPQVTTNPATDVLPIVNIADNSMAASGSTRKITVNQLLGAGGTATLASATISGDLTVDTNTLKVVAATDSVGVGTPSPTSKLHVSNTGAVTRITITDDTTNGRSGYIESNFSDALVIGTTSGVRAIRFSPDNKPYYQIATDGVQTWLDGIGGTRMTLNATGLGVGYTPSGSADKLGSVATLGVVATGATADLNFRNSSLTSIQRIRYTDGTGVLTIGSATGTAYPVELGGSTSSRAVTIDASSNVGIGVTPSAWGSNWKANHVGTVGSFASSGAGSAPPTAMVIGAYNDNTNWKYQFASTGAARYEMTGANAGSVHAWYTSPGGTVNTNITDFATPKMTLDASGNLLVGLTNTTGANYASKFFLSADSGTTKWCVGPYAIATNFIIAAAASGGVYLNGTAATSWTSASDERLKDIIEPISNAVSKVASLRAVIGKFKSDENNTRKPFIIAQDVQAVLPEAVDASNPDKLGVAYSDVIPLLVAAIKELTAEVNALKNV